MCRAMAPRRQTCVRMSTGMPKIKAQKKALEVARRRTPQQGGGAVAGTERRRGAAPQCTGRAPSPAAYQPPICPGGPLCPKWVEDRKLWIRAAISVGGPRNNDLPYFISYLAGLLDPEESRAWTAECGMHMHMVEVVTGFLRIPLSVKEEIPLSVKEEIELDDSAPTVSESASSGFA